MDGVFSEVVGTAAWREGALLWIRDQLGALGVEVTGALEQPRIRPWATQLVVPTTRGTVWFKANCPELAFEPLVHQRLSRLVPDEVDAPLAIEPERGWMMTADRGATLGDSHEATLEDWQAVLTLAASLQRGVTGRGRELVGAGLPDCSPETVPARYAWLIEQLAGLPADHPSHLDGAQAARLRDGIADVARAVATLLAAPLPTTLQHGDLHPHNVFAVGGGLRIFDFGDAQWAHALEVLAVPYGYVTRLTDLPWAAVLDAYAAGWADVVDRATLEELMPAAMVAHAVNRSFTWLGAIAGARPEELAEWGDSPLYYLRMALERFPPPTADTGL